MVELIFKILGTGLSIWETKEKRKYIDELLELKKAWYYEDNKPFNQRDNSALDNIERRLFELGDIFASGAAKSDAGPTS